MAGGAEKAEPVFFPESNQGDFCKASIATHCNVFFRKSLRPSLGWAT